jgi:orotate phosphoribosyltransferase
MSLGLLIGLTSLGFTALGSIAAVMGIRQSWSRRRVVVTIDSRSARRLLRGRVNDATGAEAVISVISRHIFASGTGRTAFGTLDKMESSVFLDLFTACTDPVQRKVIGGFISNAVRDCATGEKLPYVAVAKEGNVLLADEVARQLNFGLVVVRTKVPAIRFGNPIEGTLPHGSYVILVDDVAADGEMLVRVVQRIRRYGGRVEHALCVAERLDGSANERLAARDVKLSAPIKLDEKTLRELRKLSLSAST